VYSILKKREFPASKLLTVPERFPPDNWESSRGGGGLNARLRADEKRTVVVLEAGVVGSLDYKIIEASRADDLFKWLKDNKYHYAGDEAELKLYVQNKRLLILMK